MKDSIILQDKNYISAKRVHELFGYTSDYIGQLCRAGKLESKMVGRSWFVTEKSVREHLMGVDELLKSKAREKNRSHKRVANYLNKYKENLVNIANPEVLLLLEADSKALVELKPIITNRVSPIEDLEFVLSQISSVPNAFALPYAVSENFLIAPFYKKANATFLSSFEKISLATGTLAIAFIFLISIILPGNNFFQSRSFSSMQASLGSFVESVFNYSSNKIAVENTHISGAQPNQMQVSNTDIEFNGLAVVPSTNSEVKDEAIKQKIRDSFSDEVQVKPDRSGTAGLITPVFRKAKGDDFIYVLVPVNK